MHLNLFFKSQICNCRVQIARHWLVGVGQEMWGKHTKPYTHYPPGALWS